MKRMKKCGLVWVCVLLAAVLLFGCAKSAKKLEWPTTGLAAVLPQPDNARGEIGSNSATDFDAQIQQTTEADYQA